MLLITGSQQELLKTDARVNTDVGDTAKRVMGTENRAESTSGAIRHASVGQNSNTNEEWCQRGCTKVPQSWNHNYVPIMRDRQCLLFVYYRQQRPAPILLE